MADPRERHDLSDVITRLDELIKRMDRAAALDHESRDVLFSLVSALGRGGFPTGIALMVDGALITGVVATDGLVDLEVAGAARDTWRGLGLGDDDGETVFESLSTIHERISEDEFQREEKAQRFGEGTTFEDLSPQDVFDFYDSPRRSTIDLEQVTIRHPGSPEPIEVSAIRITMAKISAWWPVSSQVGTQVHYSNTGPPKY